MDEEFSDKFVDNYEHIQPHLVYTGQNILGPGADVDCFNSLLSIKCECVSGYCGNSSCLCLIHSIGRNYAEGVKRLIPEKFDSQSPGIIECNYLCSCSKNENNCSNRVVQYGPVIGLYVFKDELKGYGLKCKKKLKKGDFICEYAGELIGISEAKLRFKYSCDKMNFIFILGEHTSENETIITCIDPTKIGNIGRYINHSCQPNAAIIPVRFDSVIPHLAVFAINDILIDEEITFDYSGGNQSHFNAGSTPCLCGSSICKKFIPFSPDLIEK